MVVNNNNNEKTKSLQDEISRLKHAVLELAILNKLSLEIGSITDSEKIMNKIVKASITAVNAEQGVVSLIDQSIANQQKTLVRAMVSSSNSPIIHLNQLILGWMIMNLSPLIINDPKNDHRFKGVNWDDSITSVLAVPLMIKSKIIGILCVYNKRESQQFTSDDKRLLSIIAAQSAQVVENARLMEEEKLLIQMKEEVKMAGRIQIDLLPKQNPQIDGYEITGKSIPAQTVGGDYFDFIPLDENRIAICLGDVSGKGLPASLLMANLQASIRAQTLVEQKVSKCVENANNLIFHSTTPEKFVTFFFGILNTQNNLFTYSNAGHDSPFFFKSSGEIQRLTTHNILLGFRENFPFSEKQVEFNAGDILLIYTDGITESWNTEKEEFGEERLQNLIKQNMDITAYDLQDKVYSIIEDHSKNCAPMDDETLIIIKRR